MGKFIHKNLKLKWLLLNLSFFWFLILQAQISSSAPGIIDYSGTVNFTDSSSTGQGVAIGSGAVAASNVEVNYAIPYLVAIGIYDQQGSQLTSPFLAGANRAYSKLLVIDQSVITDDIIKQEDEPEFVEDFFVNGVLFSTSKTLSSLRVIPETPGTALNTIKLMSSKDQSYIIVSITGTAGLPGNTVTLDMTSRSMTTSSFDSQTGLAPFHLGGDVDESTVTPLTKAGAYVSNITVTAVSP